jgi:hypothetical protein
VPVSASTNCEDGAFAGFAEFSTIDVDKSVRNCPPLCLNTRPQRKKPFGTKSNQVEYFNYFNKLQKLKQRQ